MLQKNFKPNVIGIYFVTFRKRNYHLMPYGMRLCLNRQKVRWFLSLLNARKVLMQWYCKISSLHASEALNVLPTWINRTSVKLTSSPSKIWLLLARNISANCLHPTVAQLSFAVRIKPTKFAMNLPSTVLKWLFQPISKPAFSAKTMLEFTKKIYDIPFIVILQFCEKPLQLTHIK